ncbi:hypothetical protein A2U01_0058638 [Trifolium medium]|uniref:Uncharacterized protein n=1 Tax=Trifolium medium TaxID=97028 RepID=A0A392RMV9_9FABA|nr:hypothetical protein [Trifolium medium]
MHHKKASLAFSSPIAKASLLIVGTKHCRPCRRPRRLFQDVETVVGGAMIGVYHPHHSDTSSPVVTDPVASSPDLNRCRLSFGGDAQVCVKACRHRF